MSRARGDTLYYKRSRFVTHLPTDRRYTSSHFWLVQEDPGVWRVGLTRFALRMLGEIVEVSFQVVAGDRLALGQVIGALEGFKAVSELYSTVEGSFLGTGDEIERDITVLETDPYERGWLFRARGTIEPRHLDVHGYTALLDTTIDKMLETRHDEPEEQG
jgi:glycine cleavage system H protein